MTADRRSNRNPAPAEKEPDEIHGKSSFETGPDWRRPGRAAAERRNAERTAKHD
jgi:hypothetical protein